MVEETDRDSGIRLAEIVAALSRAADLGLGQPMEHAMRGSLISLRLAEKLGLDEDERAALYYVGLLAWVGCTADSYEMAGMFGDDIELRADTYEIDMAGLPLFGFLLRHVGSGSSALKRARLAAHSS